MAEGETELQEIVEFTNHSSLTSPIMDNYNRIQSMKPVNLSVYDPSSLSPELIKKAEEELMEKSCWRERDIQALRDMVLEDSKLVSRTDDAFLLRFLRARKFDYDRALKLLKNYYALRVKYGDVFKNFVPSAVRDVLHANYQTFLPRRDNDGRAIFVFRGGMWDPSKFTADDLFRANIMCLERAIDEPETQINGIIAILDMKNLCLHHIKHFTPSHAYRIVSIVQDSFPARFKAVHIVNEPALFDIVFAIVKPLLNEKLKNRVYVHGDNMNSLHQHIPPEILPLEYAGELGPFNNGDWAAKLFEHEDVFTHDQMFGYISLLAEKGVKKTDGFDGLFSYRRVCIR